MRWDDLREVTLPPAVPGRLFLMAMPGRQRPLEGDIDKALAVGVTRLVCLVPLDEVAAKSPRYAQALASDELPWPVDLFPIENEHRPRELEPFARFVLELTEALREGERLLLHCAAGVGRTGTVAACVLVALGLGLEEALDTVRRAGSFPETAEQREVIAWFAERQRQAAAGPSPSPAAESYGPGRQALEVQGIDLGWPDGY